jgi:hypothetical protein
MPAVTRVVRGLAPDQSLERAATLEGVRPQVLSPERLNAFVFSGFAGIALLIAAVGVAGVLAFSVSARTREFGVRLAVGSTPTHLPARVLFEGAASLRSASSRAPPEVICSRAWRGNSSSTCNSLAHFNRGVRGCAHRGGDRCVIDAGGACLARGRAAGVAIGMIAFLHHWPILWGIER